MTTSVRFIRVLFSAISIVLTAGLMIQLFPSLPVFIALPLGLAGGAAFSLVLIGFERVLRQTNLRSLNVAILGLFVGLLFARGLRALFDASLGIDPSAVSPGIQFAHAAIEILATFTAIVLAARTAEDLYVSIPFVKLRPTKDSKKDLLIDQSILLDARILDISATGIFDNHLVLPRFVVNELHRLNENAEEGQNNRAHRALQVLKKLEAIPTLNLRYTDLDIPEEKDASTKMIRLARLQDASVLTADISRIQRPAYEGVSVINIHTLSNSLKPLMQTGETIDIKVQRYGKEPRQGVGYLEDGTMVVVNGGGEYIGQVIQANVLSVKHTSSGRMIFCNAFEEEDKQAAAATGTQARPQQTKRQPAGVGSSTDYFSV